MKDIFTVLHYLGSLIVVAGVLMVVPFVVAIVFGEYSCAADFLTGFGACMLVGALLRLFTPSRLDRRRSLLLCGVAWVFVGIMAAVPLYLSGGFDSFLDAVFDAVSALTTTGVSVVNDIDRVPYSQVTWRAILSLAGAQAIIIVSLYLGFFGGGGYSARSNAKARHESTGYSLRETSRYVWLVAGLIVLVGTIVVMVICLIHGFSVPDALMNGFWLSSSAYSTGSFVPHASSLIFYHSTWLDAFLSILMLLGALNFSIYALTIAGKGRRMLNNSETRLYIVWIVVLVAVAAIIQCREGIFAGVSSLFDHSTFMIIAGATTSGMQTVYPEQMGRTFSEGAFILLMVAMFVGSSSCSTGGGLKIFRIQRIISWFGYTIRRALLPNSVQLTIRYEHFGTKRMSPEDAGLAMAITVMYLIAAALGSVMFIAHGYDALGAICESISYVTNSGITAGITAPEMTPDLIIVAMVLMWAGRLEFVALIAIVVGLIISVRPYPEAPGDHNVRTRRVIRNERRRQAIKDFFKTDESNSGFTRVVTVIVAALLAVSLVAAPLAFGEDEVEDLRGDVSLTATYRPTTISELMSATSRLDDANVRIVGEVMGPSTRVDGQTSWINIKFGDDMVGVLVTADEEAQIMNRGAYGHVGDHVIVTGTFQLDCEAHSGELDVHADSLKIISRGYATATPVSYLQVLWGVVMAVVGLALLFLMPLLKGIGRKGRNLL